MVQAAMISITGTQQLEGEEPESIQLVTEGSYCYEPGYIRFSYVETQMTGLEGVHDRRRENRHASQNRQGQLHDGL